MDTGTGHHDMFYHARYFTIFSSISPDFDGLFHNTICFTFHVFTACWGYGAFRAFFAIVFHDRNDMFVSDMFPKRYVSRYVCSLVRT
jgi:hypothetical protein